MTQITPHKGGRTARLFARISPEVLATLDKLRGDMSRADWIEAKINEAAQAAKENEMAKKVKAIWYYIGDEQMKTRGDYGVAIDSCRQIGDHLYTFDPDYGDMHICHVRYAEEMGFSKTKPES